MSKEKDQIEKLQRRNEALERGLQNIIKHHKILSPTCYKRVAAAHIAIQLVGDSDE